MNCCSGRATDRGTLQWILQLLRVVLSPGPHVRMDMVAVWQTGYGKCADS